MSKKYLTVAYNPNDFFYYKANFSDNTKVNDNQTDYGVGIMDAKCDAYINSAKTEKLNCRASNINNSDLSGCYNNEVCLNKKYATTLLSVQTNHDGADIRKNDVTADYNRQYIKMINLSIGCLGIIATSYFLYK